VIMQIGRVLSEVMQRRFSSLRHLREKSRGCWANSASRQKGKK